MVYNSPYSFFFLSMQVFALQSRYFPSLFYSSKHICLTKKFKENDMAYAGSATFSYVAFMLTEKIFSVVDMILEVWFN